MKKLLIIFSFFLTSCFPVRSTPSLDVLQKSENLIDNGVLLLREKKFKKALSTFQASAELYYSAKALDGIGCAYLMLNDIESAQEYFLEAYNLDNNYAPALEHLALLYDLVGYVNEANYLYKRAIFLDPTLIRARNNHAIFSLQNGLKNKKNVIHELEKADSIFNHTTISQNLRNLKK